MFLRVLFVLISALTITYASEAPLINTGFALQTMAELLDYHVEHKKLNAQLMRRTIKLFVEQFDPDKSYLLQTEVDGFFHIESHALDKIAQQVQKKDFSFFYRLSLALNNAMVRAQKKRAEIFREYILKKDFNDADLSESFVSYAEDERALEDRIRKKALRFLFAEAKLSKIEHFNPDTKEKIFQLMEKKIQRFEKPYAFTDRKGYKVKTEVKEDHFATQFLKAFAKSLDAHTSFFTHEEAAEMRSCLEKQFEGIGIVLREGVRGVEISDLVSGGPAERSQLIHIGDLLKEIDGRPTAQMDYDEILKSMKGDPGSKISLKVEKVSTQEEKTVVLKREKILLTEDRIATSYEPIGDGIIGKISLSSFYESGDGSSCENDIRKAIKDLKGKGNLKGLILDLRFNSGGFLTQAVKVAGLFIKSGVVVISKYSQGKTSYLRDLDGKMFYDGPLIVLTSKASASAAEIVAQALQDYGTAIIVGDERTYGKGTIQYQNVTDKTASSYFKVTVGKYYTVSGRTTQIEGVKADIVVPTQYYSLNIGERYLDYALSADNIGSFYLDPLHDIDESRKAWFSKNYLPYLQAKDIRWQPYISTLYQNSEYRVKNNKDYQNFLLLYDRQKKKNFRSSQIANCGMEDLPLEEASKIMKDMVYIKQSRAF